mgnify:CR=1 FL=1
MTFMKQWENSHMKNNAPHKNGKKSGPPPKSGPTPQGLNLKYNTVKTVKLEKINGRRR